MTPDFLSVGFVTHDLIGTSQQAGGSAYYGAKTAQQLGLTAGIWTSASKEFLKNNEFDGIEVFTAPTDVTTTFTHFYDSTTGHRTHLCKIVAPSLDPRDLPSQWTSPKILMVCPNGAEVSPEILRAFTPQLTGVMPQGWFRKFNDDGSVQFVKSKFNGLPKRVDLIVVSEDDLVHDAEAWNWITRNTNISVRTMGRRGHVVAYEGRERTFSPPHVADDVDPTGAGDVFSAAMLIALSEGADPLEAARFGSVAASFAVEKPSTSGLPTREQINERLRGS